MRQDNSQYNYPIKQQSLTIGGNKTGTKCLEHRFYMKIKGVILLVAFCVLRILFNVCSVHEVTVK